MHNKYIQGAMDFLEIIVHYESHTPCPCAVTQWLLHPGQISRAQQNQHYTFIYHALKSQEYQKHLMSVWHWQLATLISCHFHEEGLFCFLPHSYHLSTPPPLLSAIFSHTLGSSPPATGSRSLSDYNHIALLIFAKSFLTLILNGAMEMQVVPDWMGDKDLQHG